MKPNSQSWMWKSLLRFFLSVVIFQSCVTSLRHRSYPKKIHERVMAKLNQRRGNLYSDKIGTWANWSSWNACSRSCGTGVTTQSRECRMRTVKRKRLYEHKTKQLMSSRCVGRYKRFQLCNKQKCPGNLVDFRSEQCSVYNQTPFNRRFYTWVPFIEKPESCTLNCRAHGLSFYATLNQSVIDGTPCGLQILPHDTQPMLVCVEGTCMIVGCDGLLGSGKTYDLCGQCDGDNTTCRLISEIYSKLNIPFGYNLVATVPPGAINLSIYHLKPSHNYLALREVGGRYLLNGPWGLNKTGELKVMGTMFSYTRSSHQGGDYIHSKGPTKHSLDIMLFSHSPDPGIKYEYRLPAASLHYPSIRSKSSDEGLVNDAIYSSRHIAIEKKRKLKAEKEAKYKTKLMKHKERKEKKRKKRYRWIVNGFTQCSQTCGGGTQTTRSICVKRKRKDIEAPTHFCASLPPPREQVVRCNLRPCPPMWEANTWSDCSVTCGTGLQKRTMSCRQRVSSDLTIDIPEKECEELHPIPTAQVCQLRDCNGTPKWEVEPWALCSSQCGIGSRIRRVTCTSINGDLEDKLCEDPKPIAEEMCDMGSCATDTWFFSTWDEECRGSCGEGTQTRQVHCSGNAFAAEESATSCAKESKPVEERTCDNRRKCEGSWFAGPWSECSSRCGTGRQRRAVICITWQSGRYKVSKSGTACKAAGVKPQEIQMCISDCNAEWFTSDWSQCSASCKGGVQRREVKCLDQQLRPSMECLVASKPDSRQSCNIQPCNQVVLANNTVYDIFDESNQKLPNDSSVYIETNERPTEVTSVKKKDKSSQSKDSSCLDRMKNCHLVYKARLCRLKYYSKLCCKTCSQKSNE